MTQITLTQNCTDCETLFNQVVALCADKGITNAMCSIVASAPRDNMVGIIPIIYGGLSAPSVLRYRNNTWGMAQSAASFDADARIGDVYNVYEPDGLWNSQKEH